MAIDLPTLIQRVRVDTSGLAKAEAQARAFGTAMSKSSRDIDGETKKLSADTDRSSAATLRSNASHAATPGSVGPASRALRENSAAHRDLTAAHRDSTKTASEASTVTRRLAASHDGLSNSVRKSSAEMKKAKADSQALHGVFKNLAKVMAPGAIVGVASFISPALTAINSLGAGAIAAVGGLGQMTTALGAAGFAAVASISQISGAAAALPGFAGAFLTAKAAIKATFTGTVGKGAGYDAAVKTAAAANQKLAAAQGKVGVTAAQSASNTARVTAATLRAAAATSRYQQVVSNPRATQAQKLSAQASVVSANASVAAAKAAGGKGGSTAGVAAAQAAADKANAAVAKFGNGVADISKEVDVYKANLKDMGNITRSITVPGFIEGMKAAEPVFDVLKGGAKSLAQEIAPLAVDLGKFVGSKGFLSDLTVLADNNAKVFGKLGGSVRPLAGTFANITVAAAPMTLALAGAVQQFAQFWETKTSDRGGLTAFFTRAGDQAISMAKSLGNVLGAIVNIGSIGSQVFFGTKGLSGGLEDSTAKLNDWTKSGAGIEKITGFFTRMKPIAVDTWSALKDFTGGLYDLFKIGNDTFFGSGGMASGIAETAKRFSDWTDSPAGIKAITGYFREMKPIASEAWLLVKQVMLDLFALGRDTNTAGLLKSLREDFLPVITTMLTKMSTMAPAVVSTLKGIADFAGALDPTIILSVANAFGSMASNLGTLVTLVPGIGTLMSLLGAYLIARKLLGGVLVPLIGLAGGKGGALATMFGGAKTAGATLRAGGVAAGAALEASAITAAETLRVGAAGGIVPVGGGKAGAASKVATAESAGVSAAAVGLGKGGAAKTALTTVAKTALRGAIWAAIGYMIGDTIVGLTAKPAAAAATKSGTDVLAAKKVYDASKKTAADSAIYQKALTDASKSIGAFDDSLGGKMVVGLNAVETGVGNFFGGGNKRNLTQAQADAVKALDAETARVKLQTEAERSQWLMTPAGIAWQGREDKKKKVPLTPAQQDKAATGAEAARVKTDKQTVADWEKGQKAKHAGTSMHGQTPWDTPPPDIVRAREHVANAEKAATEEAAKAATAKAVAAKQTQVTQLGIIAKQLRIAADQKTEGPGGRQYDAAKRAAADAAEKKLLAAQSELNTLRGAPKGAPTNLPVKPGVTVKPGPGHVGEAAPGQGPAVAAPYRSAQQIKNAAQAGLGVAVPTVSPTVPQAQQTVAQINAAWAKVPGIGTLAASGLKTAFIAGILGIGPAVKPAVGVTVAAIQSNMAAVQAAIRAAMGLPPLNETAWFDRGAAMMRLMARGVASGNKGVNQAVKNAQAIADLQSPADGGVLGRRDGGLLGRQTGGLLWGSRGGPREDNLLFKGSRGEFVVNAAAYKKNRALVEAINAGRMASGGRLGRYGDLSIQHHMPEFPADVPTEYFARNPKTGEIFIADGVHRPKHLTPKQWREFNEGTPGSTWMRGVYRTAYTQGYATGGLLGGQGGGGVAYKRHRALMVAANSGQFRDGGMLRNGGAVPVSPFMPQPAVASVATAVPGPRPVEFHIGTVEDGDTLLRRARATDRMMSLAEGGDSAQMRGIGI